MSRKRDPKKLVLQSIWDDSNLCGVVKSEKNRAKLWNWMIAHPNIPLSEIPYAELRIAAGSSAEALKTRFVRFTSTIVEKYESKRGDTVKLLVKLQDGHTVETVIMKHRHHSTVCISSQIGCQMGCRYLPIAWRHVLLGVSD
jgi:adenine C2-methylase RlmN of 23S rRNA A2503 and tRNA A37